MQYINYTPDTVVLNSGERFEPSGIVAKAVISYHQNSSKSLEYLTHIMFEGMPPPPQEGVKYIVSNLILFTDQSRRDLVAPATRHPDTVRDENGNIVSVPCFVRDWGDRLPASEQDY